MSSHLWFLLCLLIVPASFFYLWAEREFVLPDKMMVGRYLSKDGVIRIMVYAPSGGSDLQLALSLPVSLALLRVFFA